MPATGARSNTRNALLMPATTVVVALLLVFEIALRAVLRSAESKDVGAGTIVVPICGGGVVHYIDIDRSASDGDGRGPEQEVIATVDCAIFGAFRLPSAPEHLAASEAFGSSGGAPAATLGLIAVPVAFLPLSRGAPFPS